MAPGGSGGFPWGPAPEPLAPRDWARVWRALEGAAAAPLRETLDGFLAEFARRELFQVCSQGLLVLLQDPRTLRLAQRLAVLFLVSEVYRGRLERASAPVWQNAFLPVLVERASGTAAFQTHPAERAFVGQLLRDPCHAVLQHSSPEQFLLSFGVDMAEVPTLSDLEVLMKFTDQREVLPYWLRPAVAEVPEKQTLDWIDSAELKAIPSRPDLAGEAPPRPTEAAEAEVPTIAARLEAAAAAPLFGPEQVALLEELRVSSGYLEAGGVQPQQLPGLIENNPDVAARVLQQLCEAGIPTNRFYGIVCMMPISVRSLEVVSEVCAEAAPPEDFLCSYIWFALQACRALEDGGMRRRFVRLLCNFCRALMRARADVRGSMQAEVEAFCVEHSKVKEALQLYTCIKAGAY